MEYLFLQNIKENSSIFREQKRYYAKGINTVTVIKIQTSSNKNIQAIPLKNASEELTDTVLKKEKNMFSFSFLKQKIFILKQDSRPI